MVYLQTTGRRSEVPGVRQPRPEAVAGNPSHRISVNQATYRWSWFRSTLCRQAQPSRSDWEPSWTSVGRRRKQSNTLVPNNLQEESKC